MKKFEAVAKILADYKEMDVADVKPETSFEELGLDSLDTVELLMNIEEEFGMELEMQESLKTVADLVTLIEESNK